MANSKQNDFSFTISDTRYGAAPAMRRSVKRQYRKVVRMSGREVINRELDAHTQGCADVWQAREDEMWERQMAGSAVSCTSTVYRTVAVHQNGVNVWEIDLERQELEELEDSIERWREASGFYGSW